MMWNGIVASLAVLVVVAAAFTAGCGGGHGGSAAGTPRETFRDTCGGCHTLSAAGTHGDVGPNLDNLRPDTARVLHAIRTGPGLMPEDLLYGERARRVTAYVAAHAG